MKIKRYVFNDHYKKSSDVFRNILGLYFDYKDNVLHNKSYPLKDLWAQSYFKASDPELIDEEIGLYRQYVEFKPKDTENNRRTLQSFYQFEQSDNPLVPPEISDKTVDQTIKQVIIDNSVKYEDFNCLTIRTNTEQSNVDNWFANVQSKYNFYIDRYENLIQQQIIPEEVLPNFYVVSLCLNRSILDSISEKDYNSGLAVGDTSPYENFYSKFDNFITLENNMFLNPQVQNTLLFGIVLIGYCEQYAEVYDSVSVNYIETAKKRFGRLFANITNKELLTKLNEFKSAYPMYSEIIWSTDSIGPLTQFLDNAGISLQSFQDFVNSKVSVDIQDSISDTESFQFLETQDNLLLQERKLSLPTYDIGRWISNFLDTLLNGVDVPDVQEDPITSFDPAPPVQDFIDENLPPVFNNVEDLLNAIVAKPKLNEMLANSVRSYDDIVLKGELAESEILYYKIEKRNEYDELLQTFYIPNVIGLDIQTYVDTQVKYKKEYNYKIFAYTIIYGTEYYYDKRPEIDLSNNQFTEGIQDIPRNDIEIPQANPGFELPNNMIPSEGLPEFLPNPQGFAGGNPVPRSGRRSGSNAGFSSNNSSIPSFQNNFQPPSFDLPTQPETDISPIDSPFQNGVPPFSQNNSSPTSNGALPSAGGIIGNSVIPNSIANLANNIESANQLTEIIQDAELDVAFTPIYEDNFDIIFLEGYKFVVYYRPVIRLVELEYTDRIRTIVLDYPPTPPVVHFYPIKDCATRFNISLAPSSGDILEVPKPIYTQDAVVYNSYRNALQTSDPEKITFRYEGEISKYEMFRIENAPYDYLSFSTDSTLVKKEYTNIENILFQETIDSNKDYYYTFRAYDFHGKFSNPSPVYKVKIFENDNVEYLDINVYNFPKPKLVTWKSFKKFLKIDTTLEQQNFIISEDKDQNFLEESAYDQEFIIRIKSKHSGKIIDLVIKFEKEDVLLEEA